ncbi:MAG TPA: glycosyltransferase family 39 protein [Candidatus Acidoferrum sp.]|nr:glycosyltransferase family 39 protein [Candidatus Acidoferrum sp.]
MSEPGHPLRRICAAVAAVLALVAVVRVMLTYSHTAQAFDEPYHVAAAIELLDRGTYTLDPLHPPLERIAIGIPLYLSGERFPKLARSESDASTTPYLCAIGNAILNDAGRYARNLKLARLGILPFFLLGCSVVFFWATEEYGDLAGVAAVALFTTLPIVLEFSGIAYTDMVAAATQAAAFWAYAKWLDTRTWRSTVWLGVATGLALSSKFTTLLYLPVALFSMTALRWWVLRLRNNRPTPAYRQTAKQVVAAGAIAIGFLWATYGFAVGHVRESMQIAPSSIPSFQHFPAPVARVARNLVLSDPKIPAPALIRGVAMAWVKEKTEPSGYLLGRIQSGGWWYFFLVGIAVKTPVPFLILTVIGLFTLRGLRSEGRWTAMAPAVCALAILLVTLPVKINYGIRHVLVVFRCWRLWLGTDALFYGI